MDSNCIDFGSCLHDQEGFPGAVYNPHHDIIIPRAKELVCIVAASRNSRERGVAVEEALDKMISAEKENLASDQPLPQGGVVSVCPAVEKEVRKTKVYGWSVTL